MKRSWAPCSQAALSPRASKRTRRHPRSGARLHREAIMGPLLAGRDELAGKHANTQIPKVIGEARLYEVAGDTNGRKIAEFFWDRVVNHRSWVIGGNSDSERS